MNSTAAAIVNRNGINWVSVIVFSLCHAGAVVALFVPHWPAVLTALVLYWVSLSFGIGIGYHRLLTHRSFQTPKWFEYCLVICGTLALEGGPIAWVATHRIHHQHSDQPGDPHSPADGKWWSHIIWMLVGDSSHGQTSEWRQFAPDLCADRVLVWISRYNYLPLLILSVALAALGGWSYLLWGVFFRVTLGHHATWMVNSLTHLRGKRRFETRDNSRNNFLVALLSFGEGWHNNHHRYPTSARLGLAWYEVDVSWLAIRLMQAVGLAKAVRVASPNPRSATC